MIFKPYPKYTSCAIQWFNEIPQSWKQVRVEQYLIKKDENIGDLWSSTQLLSLTQKGIIEKDINEGKGKTHSDYSTYQAIDIGDLVFCLFDIDETPRTVGLSTKKGMITSAYTAFKSKENINTQYVYYFFESLDDAKALKPYYKGLRKTVRPPEFLKIHVPFPPKVEQVAISQFLDTETARIDNLIAKQEKLIELLEEQRKSIISHAVTKGLNPNAPMKDSGVEWLGEVPEHWTVLKNRHIFNFSKGLSITKENLQENGVPCVSYGEVHSKFGFEFNPEINDMKFVSEEYLETSKNCLLNSGDFIFADTSEDFEGSGNFSYLNSNSQVFAGYHTVIARLKSKQKPRFFAYIFDSNAHRKQIQTQVKGIKVFSITQGILKDIYSWLPPVHEQDLIVEYLDNECKKISLLKAKQIELIEKLKEYRASIISHAVTGKIDVREFGA